MIRYSKREDKEQIKDLLYLCFGEMVVNEGAYDNIENGRYLCYVVDDKVVAITGFCHDDEFNGIQITWTCTHPDYRHRGYMQELFKRLLATTDERIYCSCWCIADTEANLFSIMKMFGFRKVMGDYKRRWIRHHCNCKTDCPYRRENCFCSNDLYLRTL